MSFQRTHDPSHWPDLAHATKRGRRLALRWMWGDTRALSRESAQSPLARRTRGLLPDLHRDLPANPAPRPAVYCQACHLRYDTFQLWPSRRRHTHERVVAAGQLEWT